MADCEKCEKHETHIIDLQHRVTSLEDFEKWAKPILEIVKTIKSDSKYQITIGLALVGIVSYIYVYQIYPFFEKQHDSNIEVIKAISDFQLETVKDRTDFKTEIFNMLTDSKKKIITSNSEISEENISRLRRTLYNQKKDIKDTITNNPSRLNISQSISK